MLPRREKKVYVNPLAKSGKSRLKEVENAESPRKPGFWLTLLGLLMPIIKPIATRLLTKHLSSYLEAPAAAGKAGDDPDAAAAAI